MEAVFFCSIGLFLPLNGMIWRFVEIGRERGGEGGVGGVGSGMERVEEWDGEGNECAIGVGRAKGLREGKA